MKNYEFKVDENVVKELEDINADIVARSNIISQLIENHKGDADGSVVTSPAMQAYQTQLAEVQKEYERKKTELQNMAIPEALREHQSEWNLDFATGILKVTQMCDCEVAI